MARTLIAAAGFQVSDSAVKFLSMEGFAVGNNGSLVTSPAPAHIERSGESVLRLFPNVSGSFWSGKKVSTSGALIVALYIHCTDKWPCDFDWNFLEVKQAANTEIALRLVKNGSVMDLYWQDATGARLACDTSSDVITDDTWHLVELAFEHLDPGHIVVHVDGVEVHNGTGDFTNSSGDLQVILNGSKPASAPATPTPTLFDSYGFYHDCDTGTPGSDFPGQYILLTHVHDGSGTGSDCTDTGGTPGITLDEGDWGNLDDFTDNTFIGWTVTGRSGARRLAHHSAGTPQSDWTPLGAFWAWRISVGKSSNGRPIFGLYNGTGHQVNGNTAAFDEGTGLARNIQYATADGAGPAADGVSQIVQGWNCETSSAQNRCLEALCGQLFTYPLPAAADNAIFFGAIF